MSIKIIISWEVFLTFVTSISIRMSSFKMNLTLSFRGFMWAEVTGYFVFWRFDPMPIAVGTVIKANLTFFTPIGRLALSLSLSLSLLYPSLSSLGLADVKRLCICKL